MSNHYLREVDHHYQFQLDNRIFQVVTAEANYSLVVFRMYDEKEEAIRAYSKARMLYTQGRNIYECCGIDPNQVTQYVRDWEANRARKE